VNYTVVVLLQRSGNGSLTSSGATELDRFRLRVRSGETRTVERGVSPTATGTDLRLMYLFYKGDPPTDPERESAAAVLHLSVNVSDSPGQEYRCGGDCPNPDRKADRLGYGAVADGRLSVSATDVASTGSSSEVTWDDGSPHHSGNGGGPFRASEHALDRSNAELDTARYPRKVGVERYP